MFWVGCGIESCIFSYFFEIVIFMSVPLLIFDSELPLFGTTVGIEDNLLELVEKIAKLQHRSKSEIISECISRYAKSYLTMDEFKKLAIEKYLNGDMNFDELVRIIGYEEALTVHVGSNTIKESIELADKMFKD